MWCGVCRYCRRDKCGTDAAGMLWVVGGTRVDAAGVLWVVGGTGEDSSSWCGSNLS